MEARTICRNLLRRGLVVTVMKDIGRQRVTNFVARRFEAVSAGAVQYQVTNCVVCCVLYCTGQVEKERNEQLTGSAPPDTDPQSCLKIELSEQAEEGEREVNDEKVEGVWLKDGKEV